ncbi:MAG TPA: radical SAM protein [Bacteroidales bacterium]|nr:radical SAM protein [Bacteroidales bacterium]
MSTFLFDSIIFGPVWSRRLGESLGINLLPVKRKVCNFSCIYCECGLTPVESGISGFPPAGRVKVLLTIKLEEMKRKGEYLDSITFAGNGEPTLHPEFPVILEDTLKIRDRIFPLASVTVLSNATRIGDKSIFNALLKADLNILKLDSAIEETLFQINCPAGNYNLRETIELLSSFNGKLIIQTLFFRGSYMGKRLDNTSEEEVSAWLSVLKQIRPESVMMYSLARDTAVDGLERVSHEELNAIAGRVEKSGIAVQVTP